MKLLSVDNFSEELARLLQRNDGNVHLSIKRATNPPKRLLRHKKYAEYEIGHPSDAKRIEAYCLVRASVGKDRISVQIHQNDVFSFQKKITTVIHDYMTRNMAK
ncbi:Signal recognition particle SRP14 subunit [Carpediemonas membranifera]|uniref:Signal recognition particle SRP14 subunit n=1 Tax=Carpediemonas membranifera TaxID=201153 RepID=A0A8J6AZM0_9EUKA|nr:Signal recognition particle SRP14 subunit [Carpediemonas membranifera]|eukprot:KAG9396155.1 Signal recognition particle SRP14 subunit [Carpediemonas membranifera]